jgi:hypothetical protein
MTMSLYRQADIIVPGTNLSYSNNSGQTELATVITLSLANRGQ